MKKNKMKELEKKKLAEERRQAITDKEMAEAEAEAEMPPAAEAPAPETGAAAEPEA